MRRRLRRAAHSQRRCLYRTANYTVTTILEKKLEPLATILTMSEAVVGNEAR